MSSLAQVVKQWIGNAKTAGSNLAGRQPSIACFKSALIHVTFFIVNKNLRISPKCILTKLKLSTSSRFPRYCSSKLAVFLLLQCCHLVSIVTEN